MSKTIIAAVAAFALAGLSSQALAADLPSQTVKLNAVNFQDAAAVDRVYAKLKRSAQAVCDSNSANPRITQADQLCVDKALARAVRAANRPTLTAMHDRTYGGTKNAFAAQDY